MAIGQLGSTQLIASAPVELATKPGQGPAQAPLLVLEVQAAFLMTIPLLPSLVSKFPKFASLLLTL